MSIQKNNSLTVIGKIKRIDDAKTFGTTIMVPVRLIIEPDSQYPVEAEFSFFGNAAEHLDHYAPGDMVEISFSLNGKEKDGRVFNSLKAFYIRHVEK